MDYFDMLGRLARERTAKAVVRPYETMDERIRRIVREELERAKEPEL